MTPDKLDVHPQQTTVLESTGLWRPIGLGRSLTVRGGCPWPAPSHLSARGRREEGGGRHRARALGPGGCLHTQADALG